VKQEGSISKLRLPNFKDSGSQLGPPELSMDDYYQAVVMVMQSMSCQSEPPRSCSERFVIRDEEVAWPAKKDPKKCVLRAKVQLPDKRRSGPASKAHKKGSRKTFGT